jgi:hypothetical protein
MTDAPKKGALTPILIASAITLLVTLTRLYMELYVWVEKDSPQKGPGGGMAWLGIAWLVIPFGFWFGRRLAAAGRRPSSNGRALGLAFVGLALFIGTMMYVGNPNSTFTVDELKTMFGYVSIGAPVITLLVLWAWPSCWLALLLYGILARVPVIVIQYVALDRNWDTHYAKVHPKMPKDMSIADKGYALMMAQATLWIPFTILVGGLFAVVGAMTVKKQD